MLHPKLQEVTARIIARSQQSRGNYLAKLDKARSAGVSRSRLSCGNLAHAFAASDQRDKSLLAVDRGG